MRQHAPFFGRGCDRAPIAAGTGNIVEGDQESEAQHESQRSESGRCNQRPHPSPHSATEGRAPDDRTSTKSLAGGHLSASLPAAGSAAPGQCEDTAEVHSLLT